MVQREVAERLVAPPGSRVYGVPSVKLAWYASSRQVGRVPGSVFWPVPNVESALVSFARRVGRRP
jgi:16S rRNA (adenine1518-N6/adenine1519-N6)-dimethyltransferase